MAMRRRSYHGGGEDFEDILRNFRTMVERVDRRGSYYIEPTWRINGIPISQCATSSDLSDVTNPMRPFKPDLPPRLRTSSFRRSLYELRDSELREIIMNACLKNWDTHKDVVKILKQMQRKRARPMSVRQHVQNPTAGLYLYCRTQRELIDIILEIESRDEMGYFRQDVMDLVMVMKEKE
ncbi:hypothetical protein F4777DRAFT_145416 [Nemania sp. FL0916]|nr:hypothetical protein F4777DRAFT_145416 [Nemania sp. FL0916]